MSPEKRRAVVLIRARQRRAAVTAAVLASVTHYLSTGQRGPGIERPIFSWPLFIRGVRPEFFARLYRMPKDVFLSLAENLLLCQSNRQLRSCGLMRLSITLRWLAGGSYLDIALIHQQSTSSVYHHIESTLAALDESLTLKFPYNDAAWLSESSHGFSRGGRSPIEGCVAAMDGIAIKIAEPCVNDVPNPSTYFNRKGFFALNIQAMCDSSYRFLYVSALTPGSTHDSTAFAMSGLAGLLESILNKLLASLSPDGEYSGDLCA